MNSKYLYAFLYHLEKKSDDTIEVGADLYQIDTEGTATVTSSTSESENSETSTVNVPSPPAAAAVTKDNDHGRVPSIRFLGKDVFSRL